MCDCLGQTDEVLHNDPTQNTTLDVALLVNRKTGRVATRAKVATVKREPAKRQKAIPFIAEYCPFCGEKYLDKTEEA